MKAKIYSHENIIGESDLKVVDESMGALAGIFKPTEFYKDVRNVFQIHQDNPNRFEDLERIRLNVQLENGLFLLPSGGVFIWDIEGLPEEDLWIDISGVYRFVIEDFFNATLPKQNFIVEPWHLLSIQKKIAVENELRKEIGQKGQSSHFLAGYEFSAVASCAQNDDVLFAITGDANNDHAVIHLTWSGKLDIHPNCPYTDFYTDFYHFQRVVMYPDRDEWEQ